MRRWKEVGRRHGIITIYQGRKEIHLFLRKKEELREKYLFQDQGSVWLTFKIFSYVTIIKSSCSTNRLVRIAEATDDASESQIALSESWASKTLHIRPQAGASFSSH